ncbi:hypothetical protein DL764_008488 [Monosporascus ibericus]|uniref:Putative gamma-glutamylcyclotransferase n=1 Tax=Monosporascus ibericus TaxID=155417 RepID=A0A4Q4SXE1_9PEZI|nr:hypothetical protein DL764_008488 [Monosporascus ibericus]
MAADSQVVPSERTHSAFFYGTLDEVEEPSLWCLPSKANILIRSRVRHADYPGITPDPDHEVRGTYVTGLTDANMGKLDQFEGSEYERRTVKIRLLSKVGNDKGEGNIEGEEVECEAYVFMSPQHLEDREWDFEEFRTQKMKKWTREDYGFEDTDHFTPREVDSEQKSAAALMSRSDLPVSDG